MKFRVIRQHDSMQCGVACLAMICRYYGKAVSLDELEMYCPAGKRGVSLLGISEAAQDLGFHTRAARFTVRQLREIDSPCILYWNQNHFVVLYKAKRNRYHIADPGCGLVTYDEETFKEKWVSYEKNGYERGIALPLEPTQNFVKSRHAPSDIGKSPFRVITNYLSRYNKHLALIVVGLFLGCVLQLIMPFLTQSIVDVGIKRHDIHFVWLILLGELAIVTGRTATDFIRRWLLTHISVRVNISLISDFFIKLLRLPMSFFEVKHMGDLMQRMSDHSRIQSFLTDKVLGIIFTVLSFVVFGLVLLAYDKTIFLIFMAGTAAYEGWIVLFLKRRRSLDKAYFEKQSENQNNTFEFVTTMQETKLQDCCQRRRWLWEDIQADLFDIQLKSLKLQQTQEAGSIFINEIKNIVITALSAGAVINGTLSLGAMLAIQYIIGQLNSPVSQFISFIFSLQDVKLSLERINEIQEKPDEDNSAKLVPDTDGNKGITISGLSFKYDKFAENNTIDRINVAFPAKRVTAVVGESGSGKTTLVKLMLGYYLNYEGQILIGDNELKNVSLKHWRRQCGVVMQDGVIFSESIARNIAVDDSEIDVKRMAEAAKKACIYDFIMSLPLKFDTVIGRNGIGISQGQKQRILIARAIYRDPKYIFLDEATNSLDTVNERTIVENLQTFFKDRTVVIIAHRLSTVKNADNIIVMGNGRITESGTHAGLLKAKGAYYTLVKNQLQLDE